jgi:hypothetical protein
LNLISPARQGWRRYWVKLSACVAWFGAGLNGSELGDLHGCRSGHYWTCTATSWWATRSSRRLSAAWAAFLHDGPLVAAPAKPRPCYRTVQLSHGQHAGATMVVQLVLEPPSFAALLADVHATAYAGVPTTYAMLCQVPENKLAGIDTSALQVASSA